MNDAWSLLITFIAGLIFITLLLVRWDRVWDSIKKIFERLKGGIND